MSGVDEFTKHLARVRERFAAALPAKIEGSAAGLLAIAAGGADAVPATVTVHRCLHEICGIAPTLGFPATGKAARTAEAVIRDAAKHKRLPRPDEIATLQIELDSLKKTACNEVV